MGGVWLCQMVDAQHGWMVLNGDPGASMLPEMPVTTSDGGKTWKRIAAMGMPIGEDFPQLLIARSSQSASFVAGRIEGPKHPETSEYGELLVSRTDDGGQTWSPAATLYQSLPYGLSGLQNGQTPGSVCFDVDFAAADKRFCSFDGGMTWLAPRCQLCRSPPPQSETPGAVCNTGRHALSLATAQRLPEMVAMVLSQTCNTGHHVLSLAMHS